MKKQEGISDAERLVRIEAIVAEDLANIDPDPHKWPWWRLTFAKGQRPLGSAIVPAPTWMMAIRLSHELKINPGGTCAAYELSPDEIPDGRYCGRLLNKDEVRALFGEPA